MINLIYVLYVHIIMSLHEIPGIKHTHFLVNCSEENTELLKEICKMIKKSNAKIKALETKVKELKYFTDIDFTTDDEEDNEDDDDEDDEEDNDDDSISHLSTEPIHNKTYTIMEITENNSFFLELMKGPSELNDKINKLQEKISFISNKIYPNPLYTKQDDGTLTRRDIYGNKRFIPKHIILEDWKQKPTLLNLKYMSHQSILTYLSKSYDEDFTIKNLNCELKTFLIKNYKINDKRVINPKILLKFFTDYLKKKNKTIIKYNKKGSKIIYYNVWECHPIVTHILNIYKEQ